ncbi:MAG TPA: helix-hairpin-helix domain-containing protein, partial [Methanoregulaceae archaeon]|nr:helix-hairpin-helix domain-containing protein [Methanoregulaceae archaeon]
CMKNGIRRELLPLVRLRGIGRVRARRLFNHGITSPDAILAAGIAEITKILGRGVAEQVFLELGRKSRHGDDLPSQDSERNNGQSTLQRFG